MIDINKSRSSFQKFPTLKQKCKPIVLVTNKNNCINKAAAAKTAAAAAAATSVTTATTTTTNTSNIIVTATTTNSTSSINYMNNKTVLNNRINRNTKDIHKKLQITTKSSTSNSTTATATATTTNSVRASNQQFFLGSNFKDENFLKEECELAQAQLSSPKKQLKVFSGEDNRNNNLYKNKNVNNYQQTTNITNIQLPTILLANGMRQSGHGNYLANKTATATATTTTTTTIGQVTSNTTTTLTTTNTNIITTGIATTVHKTEQPPTTNINILHQYKILPKTTSKNSIINTTTVASTPYTTTKLNNRQVRPLVHRTIPITTLTAAIHNIDNNNNNNNTNTNTNTNTNNNNNNRMQQDDDIKYIDSDEVVVGSSNNSTNNSTKNPRIRPKSTIICSATNLVFEKVNNYKFGIGNNDGTRRGIDCGSIKASIDKFNSFSEHKRLPVTLRSHVGSINNLQHRHSSDFENCNVRLSGNNSNGGSSGSNSSSGTSNSITRTPYRSNAMPTGKVITSLHATAATARASTLSNSLPNKSRNCQQMERVCSSSLNIKESCNNISSPPMYKITILKQTQHAAAAAAAASSTAATATTATTATTNSSNTINITPIQQATIESTASSEAVKKNLSEVEEIVS